MPILADLAHEAFCYLTTTGRRSGAPHTIEIWFAVDGETVYLLSGGGDRADWVRNLMAERRVRLRIADQEWEADAHALADAPADARPRRLLATKYQDWQDGQPLSAWARTALLVEVRP